MAETLEELRTDGWCVNQARMRLASQFSFRAGGDPFAGEDIMFRHLLDGSRAANRLGWQWVTGASRPRVYGFARQQVVKQAPRFCEECALIDRCPISDFPDEQPRSPVTRPPLGPADDVYGPPVVTRGSRDPELVWLTAESLGARDPALVAHPDLPVVFVFDEPLLARLRLSGKRLVFLAETLTELARSRSLEIRLARPIDVLSPRTAAVTAAPVPGFARLAGRLDVGRHPWPWLRRPTPELLDHLDRRGRVPSFQKCCNLTGGVQEAQGERGTRSASRRAISNSVGVVM
ncbi:MAG: FAD-binding domain-containing protein [Acidimicrobiia bacterium]|nr:FAD-binding domain-containing protein [Acidimicrobiia bacterium]